MDEAKAESVSEVQAIGAVGDDIRAALMQKLTEEEADRAAREAAAAEAQEESTDSDDEDDTFDADDSTVTDNTALGKKDIPLMPPKNLTSGFVLPQDTKDRHIWFRILEPREHKGFDGPYNEEDLRSMYKKGDLDDNTMLWSEGRRDWEQLLYMNDLRPRLLVVPVLPLP